MVYGDELSASRFGRFTSENAPDTNPGLTQFPDYAEHGYCLKFVSFN